MCKASWAGLSGAGEHWALGSCSANMPRAALESWARVWLGDGRQGSEARGAGAVGEEQEHSFVTAFMPSVTHRDKTGWCIQSSGTAPGAQ